jgi:hypothetical protein
MGHGIWDMGYGDMGHRDIGGTWYMVHGTWYMVHVSPHLPPSQETQSILRALSKEQAHAWIVRMLHHNQQRVGCTTEDERVLRDAAAPPLDNRSPTTTTSPPPPLPSPTTTTSPPPPLPLPLPQPQPQPQLPWPLTGPMSFSTEEELEEILRNMPYGSTVCMGGKMNKIESGSVTVGMNEEEAYFEKRSSTVQRMDSTDRKDSTGNIPEDDLYRAAWQHKVIGVEENDMLIYGGGRMAAEVFGLLEHESYEAELPGVFSEDISYGNESIFNRGLIAHEMNNACTNGRYMITFSPAKKRPGKEEKRRKRRRAPIGSCFGPAHDYCAVEQMFSAVHLSPGKALGKGDCLLLSIMAALPQTNEWYVSPQAALEPTRLTMDMVSKMRNGAVDILEGVEDVEGVAMETIRRSEQLGQRGSLNQWRGAANPNLNLTQPITQ